LHTAEDIPSTDHDTDLKAKFVYLSYLAQHRVNNRGFDTRALLSSEDLATELKKDTLVLYLGHELSGNSNETGTTVNTGIPRL
jgi:hypothetical protein